MPSPTTGSGASSTSSSTSGPPNRVTRTARIWTPPEAPPGPSRGTVAAAGVA